jgi:uncharacterized protein (DUF1684 family)
MNSQKILKTLGAIVVAIILIYSFIPGDKLSYTETILKHREQTNDFMQHDEESPLPDSLKAEFTGLDYFEPDPEFKIRATLETIPGNNVIKMPTSDGQVREYIKYAYASFELLGKQHRVTLLQLVNGEDAGSLFLPFGDLTNGKTTYGGGRYLDLESTTQNRITIDFNLAYNPYCVYSADYSCPLPPAENQLEAAIEAGAKNYQN